MSRILSNRHNGDVIVDNRNGVCRDTKNRVRVIGQNDVELFIGFDCLISSNVQFNVA